MTAQDLIAKLDGHTDPQRAISSARYFKSGPGQYGEGDKFIGLTMPLIRALSKPFRKMPLDELEKVIQSPIHEHRMSALIILADTYKSRDQYGKKESFELYCRALKEGGVNNWDLVDVTAPHVVGEYAYENEPELLYKLAHSENLWEKRTAILSTFAYIKRGIAEHTYAIAEILLHDKHDLMHKAVGWLLREMGKRVDEKMLIQFLDLHCKDMPRTMLRYSLERLTPDVRSYYMKK